MGTRKKILKIVLILLIFIGIINITYSIFKRNSFYQATLINSYENIITIKLNKGWNLISFPVIPDYFSDLEINKQKIISLFGNGLNSILEVQENNYLSFYANNAQKSTLKKIETYKGYWVYMNGKRDIKLFGKYQTVEKQNFIKDFNLIGLTPIIQKYPQLKDFKNNIDQREKFCSIMNSIFSNNCELILSYENDSWNSFNFEDCQGDLNGINEQKGYFLKMKEPFTINYSEESNNDELNNPASTYCIQNGGKIEMREDVSGIRGVCIINNTECDEFEYYKNNGKCEKTAINSLSLQENNYPIILVHGFAGWGREEIMGYYYWGGFIDIQEELKKSGYNVYTAAIGPFSSNWDRAAELYAYIKGGIVDYGKAHSEKFGHLRYGKTFPGIIPDIGGIDQKTGEINKIHLIGHSMGGQTIRYLVHLLENGSKEEQESSEDVSDLFLGGKSWIYSVTTISTPHNGTTLADSVNGLLPLTQQLVGSLASVAGIKEQNFLFDYKLDQWGLKRKTNENFKEYSKRVFESNIWKTSQDMSSWDLSTKGARELNNKIQISNNVYYFTWSNEATEKSPLFNYQIPEPIKMNILYTTFALTMGSYIDQKNNIDENWLENDGIVNTVSMNGPDNTIVVSFNKTVSKGEFIHFEKMSSIDHEDIVGRFAEVSDWYKKYADFLTGQTNNIPSSNDIHLPFKQQEFEKLTNYFNNK